VSTLLLSTQAKIKSKHKSLVAKRHVSVC